MTSRPIVFVQFRQDEDTSVTTPMPTYDPDDLIGRTFLLPENEKGECLRVTIVNPNRDSPNGYPTVTPAELQPVTLAH